MTAPLQGIRIVDMSAVFSGPMATALLADHARGAKTSALPVFLTNGGQTMTATVSQQGDTTVFSI